jgi:hypothetical protein
MEFSVELGRRLKGKVEHQATSATGLGCVKTFGRKYRSVAIFAAWR